MQTRRWAVTDSALRLVRHRYRSSGCRRGRARLSASGIPQPVSRPASWVPRRRWRPRRPKATMALRVGALPMAPATASCKREQDITPMAKLTLRIEFRPERAIGPGKVHLLELIDEHRSIATARVGKKV